MNIRRQELSELRHEVYTLLYNSKDSKKKATYSKVLKLIDHVADLESSLFSIKKLFSDLL